MSQYLVTFIIAFTCTFIATPFVKKMAIKIGAVDAPNARKVHTEIIPRLGGLAIYIGYMISLLFSAEIGVEKMALIVGSTILVAVGIWDDICDISPKVKLLGQVIAALIVVLSGINIAYISNPWGDLIFLPQWFAIPFTIFWIVAFTNMINLIDGLDGLAAGISFIACLAIISVTIGIGQTETALITLALAGAILAFLRYNFNPAKIFMGDTGSMLLGYTLGVISVLGLVKTAATVALAVPVISLGVPILDTGLAIVRRYINGRPVFKPDKGHLHHRLLAMGLNHRQSVLLMYTITAMFGLISVITAEINAILGVVLVTITFLIGVYLAYRIGVIKKDAK